MSGSDPKLNRPGMRKPSPVHHFVKFADTNALLQKAIQELPADLRNQLVLRCDELANLQISENVLATVFSQLLQTIIDERETGEKLFLYITCSRADEKLETQAASTFRFLIKFHTNLSSHSVWMQEAGSRINSIATLLLPFDGSLLVNQLKKSGCVFTITLPGK